jgi:hypothetical protein
LRNFPLFTRGNVFCQVGEITGGKSRKLLLAGNSIIETTESDQHIRIYDLEKCICDLVRFRNRIGIDILKEALGEYLKRRDKDLNKLNSYAKTLKISSVLGQYLEVLI